MHLIGYGNPGRCDDGLGPAFAARMAAHEVPGLVIHSDYQLTVEHALTIAEADHVVFADALINEDMPFRFGPLEPSAPQDLSSHSLPPSAVLALAHTLFGADTRAHLMAISGIEFGHIHEGLSQPAANNLDLAEAFFLDWLERQGTTIPSKGMADA